MFVVPVTWPEKPSPRMRTLAVRKHEANAPPAGSGRDTTRAPIILLAWLLLGSMALLLVPAARGGTALGGTLPYWLVAAPLLDLAWLWRARLARALRGLAA